jgi:SAM-dependent methyltransferase
MTTATTTAPTYGEQFASFYDRLFPRDASADLAVDRLASLHLDEELSAIEFGVGTGRLAFPLARRVGSVVGVDVSPEMLAELETVAESEDGDVEAVQGDMCSYDESDGHGLVYCVLGSLCLLLDRRDQRAAFDVFAAAAAPGARVVIETPHPEFIVDLHEGRRSTSWVVPYAAPDTALLSHLTLDEERELWQLSHIFFDDGRARVASETCRLTTPAQLDEMATEAGLELEVRHGTWDGRPLDKRSAVVISTYRRPK